MLHTTKLHYPIITEPSVFKQVYLHNKIHLPINYSKNKGSFAKILFTCIRKINNFGINQSSKRCHCVKKRASMV